MIIPTRVSTPPPTPAEDRTLFAQRRAAIDEISTTRAKVIKFGLFGTYLFRPNPLKPDSDERKQSWVAEMEIQFDGVARACALVGGRDPEGYFPQEICEWLQTCADEYRAEVASLNEMQALTRKVINGIPRGGNTLEHLLVEHAVFGRQYFAPAVTVLCEAFWANLDQKRHQEVDQAREASAAIGVTLKRLEHIGRHVRLVSLNASVEAARVGDAGRGLGVIAQEFKSLAEEIQHLAYSARKNVEGAAKSTE
jgi:hypothetical protein